MMKDDDMIYPDLILKYLEGQATDSEKEALASWVGASCDNYSTFMRVKNIWEAEHPVFSEKEVEEMKRRAESDFFKSRNNSGIKRIWQKASQYLVIPLAACVALLLILKPGNREPEVSKQTVSSPYGSVTRLMLPDGSEVSLNTGSTISFPTVFNSDERHVSLTGEAFFEVLSDKEHPFIVSVEGLDIVATGTKFNVDAYPKRDSRVTLVNGVLDIKAAGVSYSLEPGHQLLCSRDNSIACYQTDTFKWSSWKDGIIAFRGDKLSYVFERLSTIFNTEIIIEDSSLADIRIRATFKDRSLDEIMSLLESCAPIRSRCEYGDNEDDFNKKYHLFLAK